MRARIAISLCLCLWPAAASAQRADEVPLEDVLSVQRIGRDLVAIGARGGGQRTLRLQIGERVLFQEARGRVGVVLTDRRVLAVTDRSAAWQEERYRNAESVSTEALLGDRVALVTTEQRVLGFDGGSGNIVEDTIGPREKLLWTGVGANVAVAVTDRRALGLSPLRGGFFPVSLRVGEQLESVTTEANLATVLTSRRLLIFRASSGSWEERNLPVRR